MKLTSNLRSPVELWIGLLGCANGLCRYAGFDWWCSAKAASFLHKSANQFKTSSWFASFGHLVQTLLKSGLLPPIQSLKTALAAVLRLAIRLKYVSWKRGSLT